jgi:hypothetical protein
MFRRSTDRFVHRVVGQLPLDVGANLIARTAHAALELLADVRAKSARETPLAWDHLDHSVPAAIEVYDVGRSRSSRLLASCAWDRRVAIVRRESDGVTRDTQMGTP